MKSSLRRLSFVLGLAILGTALAHDTDSQSGPLGKVSFPTSCDPKVQPAFERAVAMLHSFWYSAGEKAFRDVLKDDPQCAIATWGIASILMSNPLAGQGASPKGAEAGAGGDRRGTPHRREDRARARLHRSRCGLLQGLRDAPRERAAGLARQGLRGAGPTLSD